MILEHIGLSQINGSLVVLDDVKGVQYDEMVELHLDDGSTRVGRVVRVDGDRCVIQVFEGTRGLSLVNNRTVMTGHPMMMDLSPELLGRVLDGLGRPIDGLMYFFATSSFATSKRTAGILEASGSSTFRISSSFA